MALKGSNLRARKARLTTAYLDARDRLDAARLGGDTDAVRRWNNRMRLARLAWQRIDDHLYPKGR